MPLKINFKTICIYACFAAAFVFSDCAVKGVPLALGLLFAALLCGTNVIVTPVLFALASVVNLNLLSYSNLSGSVLRRVDLSLPSFGT